MKIFNKFIIGTIIVSVFAALVGCGNSSTQTSSNTEVKTIKIGYLPITHAVPLYVEDEDIKVNKEQFKNINLELVKFGSWTELSDALNTGKIDGASMLVELAMKAKEQGIDLKIAALGHRDGNNVTVTNDINSVADLKGKNFAVPQRFSTQNILLYKMLIDAGLQYSDVNVVELPPSEMPAALSEGRISGYLVAEPFGSKSVVNGKGKILFQSQDLWVDSICCGLALRNDFIKNNATAAQELVNGYVKAGKEAEAKDEKIQTIASKYMSVDKTVLEVSLKYTTYTNLKINQKDYEQLTSYLTTMGLSKNPPKYDDFVDNSLIDKAE